jgi:hypothetical protein
MRLARVRIRTLRIVVAIVAIAIGAWRIAATRESCTREAAYCSRLEQVNLAHAARFRTIRDAWSQELENPRSDRIRAEGVISQLNIHIDYFSDLARRWAIRRRLYDHVAQHPWLAMLPEPS